MKRCMMERWSGILQVPMCHNNGANYNVAASLCLTPSKTLQDFIPSINEWGEPSSYNPSGFPASSSVVQLISNCLIKVKNEIGEHQKDMMEAKLTATESTCPKTIILGFSKGGIVLNQLVTELASTINTKENLPNISANQVIPFSKESFLDSITEVHFVDVGLNSPGAYLTNKETIKKLATRAEHKASSIQFIIHGTPRQWNDKSRPWIRDEKDTLVRLLEAESRASHGKLSVCNRLYFGNRNPDLQMHFEIIDALDISSGFS